MNMKKLFIATAALALVACGNSANTSSNESASTNEASSTEEKDHLARIKEAGQLRVGLEGNWQPFSFEEDGKIVGYDVEIGQAIADHLGVELVVTPTPWDNLFLGLDADTIDLVINGVDVTEDRKKTYDFSDAYLYDKAVLIVRDDEEAITQFEDLDGKKTANSIGSTYMEIGESYGATVEGVETLDQTLEMLANEQVDATINSDASYQDYMKTHGGNFKVVDETSTYMAIPFVKGGDNDTLMAEVNATIAELQSSGKLKELSEKYFEEDKTQPYGD